MKVIIAKDWEELSAKAARLRATIVPEQALVGYGALFAKVCLFYYNT